MTVSPRPFSGPGLLCLSTGKRLPVVTGEIRPTRLLTYAAVIPTKDRQRETDEAVVVLLEQERLPEQIVVVDASARP